MTPADQHPNSLTHIKVSRTLKAMSPNTTPLATDALPHGFLCNTISPEL